MYLEELQTEVEEIVEKTADEIKRNSEGMSRNEIEITGSVFLRTAEEIKK